MKKFLEKAADKALGVFFVFTGIWICTALSMQLFFIYLVVSEQDERAMDITNRVTWKIDGTFKNNPENIWYEEPEVKK